VLDVGCGTGTDAVFLARHGIHVTAVDISSQMIAQLQAKVSRLDLAGQVETHVMDLRDLQRFPPATFDGILSAYAGLNTLSDLTAFAADAAFLLRADGRLLVHLLNAVSLWERLSLLRRKKWPEARELAQQTTRTFRIGGRDLHHHLFAPRVAYHCFFAPYFRLDSTYALGVFRPPSTLRRLPRTVFVVLDHVERRLGAERPFLNWGRFFVLDLVRRPTRAEGNASRLAKTR
jgi:SAM-dependent methyltransferase